MTAPSRSAAAAAPHVVRPVREAAMAIDGPELLRDLSETMNAAQDEVMAARRAPATQLDLMAARRRYLATVLAYQQALTLYHLPIPHKLRDEARLLQRLVPDAVPHQGRPACPPTSARRAR